MLKSWFLRVLVIAGWVGVAVGLFDSRATFLHPAPAVVIPFSLTLYGLLNMILASVLEIGRRCIFRSGRLANPGLSLGASTGFWPAFFILYFVNTSTLPALQSRSAMVLGVLAAALVGSAVMLITFRLVVAAVRRNPDGRSNPSAALLLGLIMAVGPALGLFQIQRDGAHDAGAGPPPRGFVLVSMDATRGDRISGLGYQRPTTPNIDALLPQSIAFSHAYVEMPGSAPGHASMLTGLPPLAHGVTFNTAILDESVLTLPERLQQAGFQTAAFLDNYYLESRFGFDQGFDTFINQYRATHLTGWHPRHMIHGTSVFHVWYRFTHKPGAKNQETIQGALAWLKHRPPGDFFVFLHLMDPHFPYDGPEDLRDRFYRPDGPAIRDIEPLQYRLDDLSEAEVAAMRDLYDTGVAAADRKVGKLVDGLRELGLFDSTLLVVTADHGEVLDEHGNIFDHGQTWNGNLHVPLVFCYPRTPARGLVVDAPVSASALVPTALSLLGIEYLEQGKQGFHQSLLTADSRQPAPAPPYVFHQGGFEGSLVAGVMSDRYKLIARDTGPVGLFDLVADPQETRNLLAEPEFRSGSAVWDAEYQQMQKSLDSWLAQCRLGNITGEVKSRDDLDRETLKRLRALGYVH